MRSSLSEKIINYRFILTIWVLLWLIFSIRGFIIVDYNFFKNTLTKDIREKRRYLMKEGLYDFVEFCQKRIPENGNFEFVYKKDKIDPVEKSRVMYYLYPRKMEEGALYIIVFDFAEYKKEGFKVLDRFGIDSFILQKEP